jgi:hypothetical protein
VTVLQHTAARGTSSRHGQWPFGMAEAERLTRPPAGDDDLSALVNPGEAST